MSSNDLQCCHYFTSDMNCNPETIATAVLVSGQSANLPTNGVSRYVHLQKYIIYLRSH